MQLLHPQKIIFENTGENEIHFITSENLDLLIKRSDEEIIMEFPVYDTVSATVSPSMLKAFYAVVGCATNLMNVKVL